MREYFSWGESLYCGLNPISLVCLFVAAVFFLWGTGVHVFYIYQEGYKAVFT